MFRLLASNLSVKYCVTGRLASTDITTDGFYDAGPVRVNDTLLDSDKWKHLLHNVKNEREDGALQPQSHCITYDYSSEFNEVFLVA